MQSGVLRPPRPVALKPVLCQDFAPASPQHRRRGDTAALLVVSGLRGDTVGRASTAPQLGSGMDAPGPAPCQCLAAACIRREGAGGLRRAAAPSLPEEPARCVVNRIQPELFIRSADCGFSAWMLH